LVWRKFQSVPSLAPPLVLDAAIRYRQLSCISNYPADY